jgi:hypothetical protein
MAARPPARGSSGTYAPPSKPFTGGGMVNLPTPAPPPQPYIPPPLSGPPRTLIPTLPLTPTPSPIHTPTPSASAPAPSPAPYLPPYKPDTSNYYTLVKMASKDIIVFDESSINVENMIDLLYEDIGAVELANMSRHDLIDGQNVEYSPIKNLSSLKRRFDPNNIIASSLSNQTFFSQFSIDLNSRIGIGDYLNRKKGVPFLDTDTQEIYFYLDVLKTGEIVEIEFVSSGTIDEIGS